MKNILIVGSVAFDAIETPFGKTDKIVGGSGSYISLAASYLNHRGKTNLVGVVGEDFPQEDIQMFRDHGVNVDGLQIKEGEKSFFWSGKYHIDMNSNNSGFVSEYRLPHAG